MAYTIPADKPCKIIRLVLHTTKPLSEITEGVRFHANDLKECNNRKEAQEYIKQLAKVAKERGYKAHKQTRNTYHANCHTPGRSFLFRIVPASYKCGEGIITKA